MAVLLTPPYLQFFDDNGDPLSGGKIYTYTAGTLTPKATFTDAGGLTPLPNPVVLDSAGRATIWIAGSYFIDVKDALGNEIKNTDNITAFNTTASSINSLLPTQTGHAGQYLQTDGTNVLWASSGLDVIVTTQTTTYVATINDGLVPVDATAGAFTVTLYTAVGNAGRQIKIKKVDATFNAITIDGAGTETIDGTLTKTLNTQYEIFILESNGTNWYVVDHRNVAEWTAYTPVITHTTGSDTNGTKVGFWRRVGDSIEVVGSCTFSGAVGTWADWFISLPVGLLMDAAKVPQVSSNDNFLGFGAFVDQGTNRYPANVLYVTTSVVSLVGQNSAGTYTASAAPTQVVPFAFNTGDGVSWNFRVPIATWVS